MKFFYFLIVEVVVSKSTEPERIQLTSNAAQLYEYFSLCLVLFDALNLDLDMVISY